MAAGHAKFTKAFGAKDLVFGSGYNRIWVRDAVYVRTIVLQQNERVFCRVYVGGGITRQRNGSQLDYHAYQL